MSIDISKLKMPGLSIQGLQMMEMLAKDDVDISALADIAAKDVTLSASIIKYANSPLYRRAAEITNVRNAISILGLKSIRTATSVAAMRAMSDDDNIMVEGILEHCNTISALTKLIAKECAPDLADNAEFSAMLHDLGAIVLASNFKEQYQAIKTAADTQQQPLEAAESDAFSLSHDDILATLAEKMRLPQVTLQALDNLHTRPSFVTIESDAQKISAIISLAHHLEAHIYPETYTLESLPDSQESLESLLSISPDDIDEIIETYQDLISNEF